MKNALIKILVFLICVASPICFAMEPDYSQGQTVLAIIDVQPTFDAAQDRKLLETISQKITTAIKKKQKIFFVEYSLFITYSIYGNKDYRTPTDRILTDICLNASHKYEIIVKNDEDGSLNIANTLERLGIKAPKKIKICGINTSLCVLKTVLGLSRLLGPSTKIVVLQDACRDIGGEANHKNSLRMLELSNTANAPKISIKGPYEWSEPTSLL